MRKAGLRSDDCCSAPPQQPGLSLAKRVPRFSANSEVKSGRLDDERYSKSRIKTLNLKKKRNI